MRNIRRLSSAALSLCMASALFSGACTNGPAPAGNQVAPVNEEPATGSTGFKLNIGAGPDTAKVKLVVKQVACGSEQLDPGFYAEEIFPVSGENHQLKDQFFVVDPGCYDVIALPLKEDGTPSELCEPLGMNKVVVFDGGTTEIGLVAQCKGIDKGTLDVFVLFNSPPVIISLDHDPDKFVSYCSSQPICVEFYDPDGDKVELTWDQVSGIPLSVPPVVVPGSHVYGPATGITKECVTIQHAGPGTVGLKVTAYDLMKDVDGNDWRVDNMLKTLGYASGSSDSMLFPSHGMPSANCACTPGAFPEQCDIIDNDCDGQNNEDVTPACVCNPFQKKTCYEGPAGTENKGLCRVGAYVCSLDGSAFSDTCMGQVLPSTEMCDGEDNDCDGEVDEGFPAPCAKACNPGAIESCNNYNGPPGTQDVGVCQSGTRTCNSTGTAWSACTNPTLPSTEVCADNLDNDCNGLLNDGCAVCQEPAGILKSTYCGGMGYTQYGTYSDGNCSTVDQLVNACAPECGAPSSGTLLQQVCSGTDLVGTFADGNCGTYSQLIESSSAQCKLPVCGALAELCDGLDNDADGQVDEGVCCSATPEIPDGKDNDCNGAIDDATDCVASIVYDSYVSIAHGGKSVGVTNQNHQWSYSGARYGCGMSSGKWYWEVVVNSYSYDVCVGIADTNSAIPADAHLSNLGGGNCYANATGLVFPGYQGYSSAVNAGNVVSVLLDLDTGELRYWVNGVDRGVAPWTYFGGPIYPAVWLNQACDAATFNFGPNFVHAPPVGFSAIP